MNAFPVQPGLPKHPDSCSAQRTGNTAPVLREILQAMRELATEGRESVIDLRSLPFGPGDERALKETLGVGEVSALVQALGASEVEETAYPGVWWIEHRSPDGALVAKSVEITYIRNCCAASPAMWRRLQRGSMQYCVPVIAPRPISSRGPGGFCDCGETGPTTEAIERGGNP